MRRLRPLARYPLAWVPAVLLAAAMILGGSRPAAAVEEEPSTTGEIAVAYAGRIIGDDRHTRVIVDLDRETDVSGFYINEPARIVIDLPATAFRIAEPQRLGPRGLVASARFGTMARGQSRLVLGLAHPARIEQLELSPLNQPGRHRLVIDLTRVDEAEFADLVRERAGRQRSADDVVTKGVRLDAGPREDGRYTIVIDPGHGGIDGGATGANGTIEKDITLLFAQRLAAEIERAGPFDVYLTRKEDRFVSLKERVTFALRNRADLLLSIHADSLRQKSVRGATIYTLSRKASDQLAAALAEAENRADLTAGLALPDASEQVADILADLTARETKTFSRSFSRLLKNSMEGQIRLIRNPERHADFGVLRAAQVPSVLIELGYMSNAQDEALMNSAEWRANFARLVARTVAEFFRAR